MTVKLDYKPASSNVKPPLIDCSSCPGYVYIHRDLKEITKTDDSNNEIKCWNYSEAFITADEYETLKNELVANVINGVDNSQVFENYETNLDTPLTYTNGKTYRPRYINDYSKVMNDLLAPIVLAKLAGIDLTPFLNRKFTIYDSTGKEANAVEMSLQELINLYLSLYFKKEDFFKIYKKEKEEN